MSLSNSERWQQLCQHATAADCTELCALAADCARKQDWEGTRQRLRLACRLAPEQAQAHYLLGRTALLAEYGAEAMHALRQAHHLQHPDPACLECLLQACSLYGAQAVATADWSAAVAAWQCLLAYRPDEGVAWVNLGSAQLNLHQEQAAEHSLRRAVALLPQRFEAWLNLGNCLSAQGHFVEAGQALQQARKWGGESSAEVLLALFENARLQGNLVQASLYWQSLQAVKDGPDVRNAQLLLLKAEGKRGAALQVADTLLNQYPEYQAGRWNRGQLHLLSGHWSAGWDDYQAGLEAGYRRRLPLSSPRWAGRQDKGLRLLVCGEQGLGDELLFLTCLPELMRAGMQLILECDARLHGLLQRSLPGMQLLPHAQTPREARLRHWPEHDAHTELGSLPYYLRRQEADFPRWEQLLLADNQARAHWQAWLDGLGSAPRVGISWRGGKEAGPRQARSPATAFWEALPSTLSVCWVPLQYDADAAEWAQLAQALPGRAAPWPELDMKNDLEGLAGLLTGLDLIVSVDNATVHLAAVLACPVWLLLPHVPDWRWGMEKADNPWLPTVSAFRQSSVGDWPGLGATLGKVLLTWQQRRRQRMERDAAQRKGQLSTALTWSSALTDSAPVAPDDRLQHALILALLDQPEESMAVLQELLQWRPHWHEAWYNLAMQAQRLQQWQRAEQALQQAVRIAPKHGAAWLALGTLLLQQHRLSAAEHALRRCVVCLPQEWRAWNNLGQCLQEQGQLPAALSAYQTAAGGDARFASNALLARHYHSDDGEACYQAHRQWGEELEQQVVVLPTPKRHTGAEMRVGLVSSDLRDHSVADFVGPLFRQRSPRMRLYVYANQQQEDVCSAAFRSAADVWRQVSAWDDAQLAQQIQQDSIDVLIDLNGHTAGNRLTVFARHPARLQLSWLGYPGSTGLHRMDARLVDAISDPLDTPVHASEKLWRLPVCFVCYQPRPDWPTSWPERPKRPFTFGSFNNHSKLSPACLAAWADILHAVPDSCLLLKNRAMADAGCRQALLQDLQQRGIAAARIRMLPPSPDRASHLYSYHAMDVALDSFPYNGTTTTCEALWMGVPVLAWAGSVHASRVSASILTAAGLADWLAVDVAGYRQRAVDWAEGGLPLCGHALRAQLTRSRLCDGQAYMHDFEAAMDGLLAASC